MLLQCVTAVGVLAVLTMVPGPDMAVVTKRAVASGWRDGLRTVGGITAGLLVWGVLAVMGLAAVLAASATAYTAVKLAGAAYLALLGVQALLQSRRAPSRSAAGALAPPRGNPWRTGLVGNVHTMLTALWLGGYVLLVSKARAFFEKPAVRRGMDRVTGTVLIGFGLKVATVQP
ncbi:LysE family translocator [Streptomyces violaceorubidus]|uniref:LysE family transporter n=1 Tax=Streptomyces violaceorubidus TaxID=284042 RepID=A0ABV1T654_9ACTN